MTDHRLTIERVRYHRNGMGGNPFHTVTFTGTGDLAGLRMLGTVFEASRSVAVVALDDPHRTWRGDNFEAELRTAVEAANESGESFAA